MLRGLFRDISVYSLGQLAARGLALVSFPIYTRIFDPAEYGLVSLALTVGALLSTVMAFGSDSVYVRFFFEAESLEDRRRLTTTWFAFLAAWSFGVAAVVVVAASPVAGVALGSSSRGGLVVLVAIGAPVTLMGTMFNQVLRNQFQSGRYVVMNVVAAALQVALGVLAVVVLDLGVEGVIAGIVAAQVVVMPVRVALARPYLGGRIDRALLGRLLRFGLPLVPTAIALWVFTASDRLMLGWIGDVGDVGIYAAAVTLSQPLLLAGFAVGQAFEPRAVDLFEAEPDSAHPFVRQSMTMVLAASGLVAVVVSGLAPHALQILAGAEFAPAASAAAPVAFGLGIVAGSKVATAGVIFARTTHLLASVTLVAAVVNVGANLVLIPRHGPVGAAWSTLVAAVVLTTGYALASRRSWMPVLDGVAIVSIVAMAAVAGTAARTASPRPTLVGAAATLLVATLYGAAAGAVVHLRTRSSTTPPTGPQRGPSAGLPDQAPQR